MFASECDVDEIADLWVKMTNELNPEFSPRRDWFVELISGLMETSKYFVLISTNNDKITGFIDMFFFNEPASGNVQANVMFLYVLPEYRLSGTGKLLYKRAIKLAGEHGAYSIDFPCQIEDKDRWLRRGYNPIYSIMRRRL